MKKSEIKVGGEYLAKISGIIVTVRVDSIEEIDGRVLESTYARRVIKAQTKYQVTNLRTGRTTWFRSATKFRGIALVK